jgi:hypothetical protein
MLDERIDSVDELAENEKLEHAGLALYGLKALPESLLVVLDKAMGQLQRFGCRPTLLGGDSLGQRGKFVSFARGERKLRARSNEANAFEIRCVPTWAKDRLDAEDGAAAYEGNESFVLTVCSALLSHGPSELLTTAREFCELLQPQYGIIYRVPFGYGPMAYGIGLDFNGSGRSVQDWGMEAIKYGLYRFLRNVYMWNFLTALQLEADVSGIRFQDWISKDAGRGSLTPFTDRMTLWTVHEEDISAVREALDAAGLFYGYESHLLPIIKQYRCSEEEAADHLRTGKPLVYHPPDPNQPPLTMEQILQNLGVGEPGVSVLRAEGEGKLHELTPDEIERITPERSRKKPKKKR